MSNVEVIDTKQEIIIKAQEFGVGEETQLSLANAYKPFLENAQAWAEQAHEITVTDIEDKDGMKKARAMRLQLKDLRISLDKKRKELKNDALQKGKAIDTIARNIKEMIEPSEKYLQEQEDFAKREQERITKELTESRSKQLDEYGFDYTFVNLGEMSDEQYASLLDTAKTAHETKVKAEQEAEEADRKRQEEEAEKERQRIAAEKAEQERVRQENERLRKEKEKREAEQKKREQEIARLQTERSKLIEQYDYDHSFIQLGEMEEDAFVNLVETAKTAQADKAKAEQEKKEREAAEKKRLAEEEKKRAEEQARLEQEKKEREAAEKAEQARKEKEQKLHSERSQILSKFDFDYAFLNLGQMTAEAFQELADKAQASQQEKKEREKREAEERAKAKEAEAEAKRLREAEEKRQAEEQARLKAEEEARQKALQAGDKEKLEMLSEAISLIELPELKSKAAKRVLFNVTAFLDQAKDQIATGLTQL